MKHYTIYLDENRIGTTLLENGDPPMGVVFGTVRWENIQSPYAYLASYCAMQKLLLQTDYPEDQLLMTPVLSGLCIVSDGGLVIAGEGSYLEGMESDVFTVTVYGILPELYQKEFGNHWAVYEATFK